MSNKTNHRVPYSDGNQWHEETPPGHSSRGEGHRGVIGRSKWKDLSRRSERRALNAAKGKLPKIIKFKGKPVVVDVDVNAGE